MAAASPRLATPEFAEDVRHVHACRLRRDEQLASDLGVAPPGCHEPQHLELAGREPEPFPLRTAILAGRPRPASRAGLSALARAELRSCARRASSAMSSRSGAAPSCAASVGGTAQPVGTAVMVAAAQGRLSRPQQGHRERIRLARRLPRPRCHVPRDAQIAGPRDIAPPRSPPTHLPIPLRSPLPPPAPARAPSARIISAAKVSWPACCATPSASSRTASVRSRSRSAAACATSPSSRREAAATQARAPATSSGQAYRGVGLAPNQPSASSTADRAAAGRSWASRSSVSSRASGSWMFVLEPGAVEHRLVRRDAFGRVGQVTAGQRHHRRTAETARFCPARGGKSCERPLDDVGRLVPPAQRHERLGQVDGQGHARRPGQPVIPGGRDSLAGHLGGQLMLAHSLQEV